MESKFEQKIRPFVAETEHTVTEGHKTFHKKDIADVTDLVNKNPQLLQGKINCLTQKKDVERSNSTGKFTKAGGRNSHKDTIYAKGAAVRVPDTSDDEDEIQPPKSKKAKKLAPVAQGRNVVKVNITATVKENTVESEESESRWQPRTRKPPDRFGIHISH